MPEFTPESIYTGDIELPEDISSEIWAKALEGSAFLSLARRIDLPGRGMTVPIITGDIEASWVEETEDSPISTNTFDVKHIKPYEMSVIVPVSKKFARDNAGIYGQLLQRAPYALSKLFDQSIATGNVPGSGFDSLADVEAFDIATDPYQGFVAANGAISEAGYRSDKIIVDPTAETLLYASVDDVKRPLFVPSVHENEIGKVLGRPVSVWKNIRVNGSAAVAADAEATPPVAAQDAVPNTVGFIGDWSKAVCGVVSSMSMNILKEATLFKADGTPLSLAQKRMLGIQLNFEVGFAIQDEDAFAKLTTPYSA